MKRLIYILTCTMLLMGCNGHKHPKPTPNANITIKSPTEVWVGWAGNINYEIECSTSGGNESTTLWAESNVSWITNIRCYGKKVIYDIKANNSDERRSGVITLHYGNKGADVNVMQQPEADMEFEARTLNGSDYYGKSETNDNLYNYHVILSEDGLSDDGYLYEESEYYFLDLYSKKSTSYYNRWTLPYGTYSTDSGDVGTTYSYRIKTESNNLYTETAIATATIEVSSQGINARLTLETGESVNVWYCGTPEVRSNSGDALSTLVEDYTFNIKGATLIGTFEDSTFGSNRKECKLYVFEKLDMSTGAYSGDLFQLTLILPKNVDSIAGTYRRGVTDYSFVAGGIQNINEEGMEPSDSWYMSDDNSRVAPIKSGEITIKEGEDDLYTITMDVRDDGNNSIKGTIETRVYIVE